RQNTIWCRSLVRTDSAGSARTVPAPARSWNMWLSASLIAVRPRNVPLTRLLPAMCNTASSAYMPDMTSAWPALYASNRRAMEVLGSTVMTDLLASDLVVAHRYPDEPTRPLRPERVHGVLVVGQGPVLAELPLGVDAVRLCQ